MKVDTIITIAAQCDRAARGGTNEDNCLVVSPVGQANPTVSHFGDVTGFSKMVPLRDKGCLLAVADGMGGMNAGEVASQIAVTTIAKCFSEGGMKNLEMTEGAIKKFIRKSIVAADNAIKKAAAQDREKEGMGTTVALLWILPNNTAYYAWCGDSRIYRHTPDGGLQTLSSDHSYVMEVLHLSEEMAFEHPNNNIITRSLGNPAEKANPDIKGPINIYQNDLFLLCSDGLCGVLPSRKIHEDNSCIEDVLEEHIPDADHLMDGIDELWTAAAAAGWHDNVTTLLCQVKTGPKRPEAEKKPPAFQTNKSNTTAPPVLIPAPLGREDDKKRGRKDTLIALLVVALVFGTIGGLFLKKHLNKGQDNQPAPTISANDTNSEKPPVDSFSTTKADFNLQRLDNPVHTEITTTVADKPSMEAQSQAAESASTTSDNRHTQEPSLNFANQTAKKDNKQAQTGPVYNPSKKQDLRNDAKRRRQMEEQNK